ncbi:putative Calcineurin subunit B [Blattamonas nauphoetae]|uniref:Calcineurin subunit B n=1 Tax=Blattamonas nauphoetae TaxID=2049346 RepID=A0ABQ9YM84_9EUKA|nr:putative Calcineurin subunit B [Blattamonas nauphoetae]
MGNELSISEDEMSDLMNSTSFSQEEIKRMYRKFCHLDHDRNGVLSVDEFKLIPTIASNPLLPRLIGIFDTNHDECVDFDEFITGLSVFGSDSTDEKKLKLLFDVYDVDGDGFISNGELFYVLKMMTGANMSDAAIQQLVDRTILDTDTSGDGHISFEDFSLSMKNRKVLFETVVGQMSVSNKV